MYVPDYLSDHCVPLRIHLEPIKPSSNLRYLFKVTKLDKHGSYDIYITSRNQKLSDFVKEYNPDDYVSKIEYVSTVTLLGESDNNGSN